MVDTMVDAIRMMQWVIAMVDTMVDAMVDCNG